eukprot:1151760-Pelagomonas_calceolata.AAC.14
MRPKLRRMTNGLAAALQADSTIIVRAACELQRSAQEAFLSLSSEQLLSNNLLWAILLGCKEPPRHKKGPFNFEYSWDVVSSIC